MDKREESIQFWMLNVSSFFGQLAISMVNLALVYYLRYTLFASATLVGLAASTYTSVYLICNILFSRFYQRFSPHKVVCLSLLGMGASIYATTFTSSIPLVFVLLCLYGFFMSMLWPQVEAWITRGAEGTRLNRLTSAFNFSWSFGTGISPYIASLIVAISPSLALGVGFGVFALNALMIILLTSIFTALKISPERDYIESVEKEEGAEDHSTILRYDSWIAIFIVYSALSVVLNIFPLYAGEVLGLAESTSGFLLLLRGVTTCIAFMTLGRMKFWQFKAWMIYLAEAVCILLLLVFHNASSIFSVGIFLLLFGLVFALCYSFSIFHSAAGAIDRGKRMVIHECVLTVGQVIGASFGGGIYQSLGYGNVLLALAGVSSVMLLCQLVANRLRSSRKRV